MLEQFPFIAFVIAHKWVFLFYIILIAFIYSVRRHIDWQTFGIGLYRTKVGLKLMDKWGEKYRKAIRILGTIGVFVGFAGMIFITWMLVQGVWNFFFVPGAPPVVSPVLPGVEIPGTDLTVPLVTGWLALFIVIVIHEFSHGVVSRAYDIKVKASGLLVFGPIGGAFVEPDEKKLEKQKDMVQQSMYAAGPFSNILTAPIFLALSIVFALLVSTVALPAGAEVTSVTAGYPAESAGIAEGAIITGINGESVRSVQEMVGALEGLESGEEVLVETREKSYSLVAGEHPEDPGQGYLGVNLKTSIELAKDSLLYAALYQVYGWFERLFYWTFLLGLGIGLANLLPLGPIDGGRMVQTLSRRLAGSKKKGDLWWKRISLVIFIIIIGLLLHAMSQWFI